ncbi:cation/H(+) antiporter 15-like [Hevea brasiliensis]|uniref:cation/H(+) antiporter 15-like n=1 Tax=Hevea brasiliensis TaxID=3981 RepID=UPI0025E06D4C|nr:cation/H(+) antiporter 15-like [Hevea brasiliensis]
MGFEVQRESGRLKSATGEKEIVVDRRFLVTERLRDGWDEVETRNFLSMEQLVEAYEPKQIYQDNNKKPLKAKSQRINTKWVFITKAGIIMGPSVLGMNKTYMEKIFPDKEMVVYNTMAKIGIGYFIFITAVKMDAARSLIATRTTRLISSLCFFMRIALTGIFASGVQQYTKGIVPGTGTAVVTDALSITFFAVTAEAMKDHDLLTSELGQLAMSCAMLVEMTCWVLIVSTTLIFQLSFFDSIRVVLVIVVLSLIGIYIIRPAILQFIKKTPEGTPISENLVIAIFVGASVMGVIADAACGSLFPGVLVMGLVIPDGPPLGAAIVEKSELMVMELFMPAFFVVIGHRVDVSSLFPIKDNEFYLLLILVLVSHIATILGTLFASLFCRIKLRNAILLSMILNFKGVLDFASYDKWHGNELYNRKVYTTLVLANLFLTIIYNILLDIFYKPHIRLTESPPEPKGFRSLQSISDTREFRVLTCIHSEDNVHTIISLLEACNPSPLSPMFVDVIHAIELVGRAAPLLAPYKSKKKEQLNCTDHIMSAFTNYSTNSRGPVLVRPFTMLAPYTTMHNIICNQVQDKEIPLIIVPFQGNRDDNSIQSNLVRDFNAQLQNNARCTVGILVDRGFIHQNFNHFSCNIVVIFVGGADDREALALASRMSRNPDVSITLLRINVKRNEAEMNGKDKQLDDSLVQDFKDKNSNNACVVCREVVANDSLQLLAVIRSLKNYYDLVMVGKMPIKAQFVEEMKGWIERPELGLIGDVLASSDISNGKMSVLVMQHFAEFGEHSNHCISSTTSLSRETK